MVPSGWIALFLLWVLFYWLYRDYRLDYFREKLFSLRDELFDLAAEDHVSFESPAYGMLRSTINGTIQYGHQLGFLSLLSMLLFTRKDPRAKRLVERFDHKWNAACDQLDNKTQKNLKSIRVRLHIAIVEQVIFTSAFLGFSLITLVIAILLMFLKRVIIRKVSNILNIGRVSRLLSTLDCSAAMHVS